jgi:hypothetical protein
MVHKQLARLLLIISFNQDVLFSSFRSTNQPLFVEINADTFIITAIIKHIKVGWNFEISTGTH